MEDATGGLSEAAPGAPGAPQVQQGNTAGAPAGASPLTASAGTAAALMLVAASRALPGHAV
jgi:hypothetical protein